MGLSEEMQKAYDMGVDSQRLTVERLTRERDEARGDLVAARDTERSHVVRFLREALRREAWGDLSMWDKWRSISEVVSDLTTAIERGEHAK